MPLISKSKLTKFFPGSIFPGSTHKRFKKEYAWKEGSQDDVTGSTLDNPSTTQGQGSSTIKQVRITAEKNLHNLVRSQSYEELTSGSNPTVQNNPAGGYQTQTSLRDAIYKAPQIVKSKRYSRLDQPNHWVDVTQDTSVNNTDQNNTINASESQWEDTMQEIQSDNTRQNNHNNVSNNQNQTDKNLLDFDSRESQHTYNHNEPGAVLVSTNDSALRFADFVNTNSPTCDTVSNPSYKTVATSISDLTPMYCNNVATQMNVSSLIGSELSETCDSENGSCISPISRPRPRAAVHCQENLDHKGKLLLSNNLQSPTKRHTVHHLAEIDYLNDFSNSSVEGVCSTSLPGSPALSGKITPQFPVDFVESCFTVHKSMADVDQYVDLMVPKVENELLSNPTSPQFPVDFTDSCFTGRNSTSDVDQNFDLMVSTVENEPSDSTTPQFPVDFTDSRFTVTNSTEDWDQNFDLIVSTLDNEPSDSTVSQPFSLNNVDLWDTDISESSTELKENNSRRTLDNTMSCLPSEKMPQPSQAHQKMAGLTIEENPGFTSSNSLDMKLNLPGEGDDSLFNSSEYNMSRNKDYVCQFFKELALSSSFLDQLQVSNDTNSIKNISSIVGPNQELIKSKGFGADDSSSTLSQIAFNQILHVTDSQ